MGITNPMCIAYRISHIACGISTQISHETSGDTNREQARKPANPIKTGLLPADGSSSASISFGTTGILSRSSSHLPIRITIHSSISSSTYSYAQANSTRIQPSSKTARSTHTHTVGPHASCRFPPLSHRDSLVTEDSADHGVNLDF